MGPFFMLDKLAESAGSPHLVDQMRYVFRRSRGEDQAFARLLGNLCIALHASIMKKRKLVVELEAGGDVEGSGKSLENFKAVVSWDADTLGELEKLLARAQVGVNVKAGFLTELEPSE